tara:strand:- start:304 stop:795 length:492 start_codon:yes stop_codon:yes gene_type:complete
MMGEQMMQQRQTNNRRDHDHVPIFLVRAMFGLMALVTVAVAVAQWVDLPQSGVLVEAPEKRVLMVQLHAQREGVTEVLALDGKRIASSSEPLNGFIDVIGRAMTRARVVRGVGDSVPFKLVERINGRIAIIDTGTGQVVELIGYGADNVAAFAKLVAQHGKDV